MGCSISVSLIQNAISRILSDYYLSGCIVYCDDILVYSEGGLAKHLNLVHNVLDKLEAAGAQVIMEKRRLGLERVTFLDLDLSKKGWAI